MKTVRAVVGMGSNLGDSQRHLYDAARELGGIALTRVTRLSPLYLTKPVGPQDQNYFVNAVAELETGTDAPGLLAALQRIERAHGRTRTRRWGERTLDLDLLFYGDERRAGEFLTLPHPEVLRRVFTVVPLLAIDPEFTLPDGTKLRDSLGGLPGEDLRAMRRLTHMDGRGGKRVPPGKRTLRLWFALRTGLGRPA